VSKYWKQEKSIWKRDGFVQPKDNSVWEHRTVRCARLALANWMLSGFVGGVRLKITGLSGGVPDCPVSQWSAEPTVGRVIRA
jgi:hypothetical protein